MNAVARTFRFLLFCPALCARPAPAQQLPPSFARLPLAFEANRGQADPRVRFLARGPGYTLFLTPNEAVFALKTAKRGDAEKSAVLRMKLVGAKQAKAIAGMKPLPGKINYFLGRDPKKWRTNIPAYGKVRYQEVYKGIDLVYYGNPGQLEYDFVVKPGANPKAIRVALEGTKRLRLDARGDLLARTEAGEVRWHRPLVYQEVEGKRKQVAARYVLLPTPSTRTPEHPNTRRQTLTFEVASYDRARPLVIDPQLSYLTYLGGSGDDYPGDLGRDSAGNLYVAGYTTSTNFPTTQGAYRQSAQGGVDIFVSKLDPTASSLLYSTYVGGSGDDYCYGMAVNAAGEVYLTGTSGAFTYPTTSNAYQPGRAPGFDAIFTKVSADGSQLIYSSYLGGDAADYGRSIAVDAAGNAYITGTTASTNFPTTVGAWQRNTGGLDDAFIVKMDPSRSGSASFLYGTYLGGSSAEGCWEIAVDADGKAYVVGQTISTNFPTTASAFQPGTAGATDAFVACLNAAGSALVYSTYLGGTDHDYGNNITIDALGNVYVTGQTASTNFPTTATAFRRTLSYAYDLFVTKLNASGSVMLYSTYLGGSANEQADGIAVDNWGNTYVVGETTSTDFTTTANAFQRVKKSGFDVFATKLNARGSELLYSTFLGGGLSEAVKGVALDSAGNVYATGNSNSTDLPVTPGAYQSALNGGIDAFLVKIPTAFRFDIAGNGNNALFFQNSQNGGIGFWLLNGLTWSGGGGTLAKAVNTNWKLASVADLNGDGKPDLLWWNQQTGGVVYWLLDGTWWPGIWGFIVPSGDPNWKAVCSADLNRDGMPDLLWQNAATGAVSVWYLSGTFWLDNLLITPNAPANDLNWKLVGSADFNGDGKPDLVWQHQATGAVAVWYLNGTQATGGAYITNAIQDWRVVGIPDLNGDGKPDLLWQRQSDGAIAYWQMNGIQLASAGFISQSVPANWLLSGMR